MGFIAQSEYHYYHHQTYYHGHRYSSMIFTYNVYFMIYYEKHAFTKGGVNTMRKQILLILYMQYMIIAIPITHIEQLKRSWLTTVLRYNIKNLFGYTCHIFLCIFEPLKCLLKELQLSAFIDNKMITSYETFQLSLLFPILAIQFSCRNAIIKRYS